MKPKKITRRIFLISTAAGIATGATLRRRPRYASALDKLNIAGIGVGGMGHGDVRSCGSENIVALCDVDWARAADTFKEFPDAKRYKDYRVMLEEQKDIDAVTVSTPDHTHAPAALLAMELGKHVRVQKPLTWSIKEARQLTEVARKYKVATAMGNQGHAGSGVRQMCEILWSDAIGPVREAHIWTNRPVWPQGIPEPLPEETVPETMAWDLWLGVAPARPYNQGYAPFSWRGWWDFGCGALGDMGCHIMDPANWALQLGAPTSVECVQEEGNNDQTGPTKSIIRYEFPARPFKEEYPSVKWYGRTLPPVTVYWHDGGNMPPRPEGIPQDAKLGDGDNGSYFIGDKGIATTGCYGGGTRLLPVEHEANKGVFPGGVYVPGKSRTISMADFTMPDEVIPRVPDNNCYQEWINACKGGVPAGSRFEYAGPFTEMVNLGNLAVRVGVGRKVEWDTEKLASPNVPEANQYVSRAYRTGW